MYTNCTIIWGSETVKQKVIKSCSKLIAIVWVYECDSRLTTTFGNANRVFVRQYKNWQTDQKKNAESERETQPKKPFVYAIKLQIGDAIDYHSFSCCISAQRSSLARAIGGSHSSHIQSAGVLCCVQIKLLDFFFSSTLLSCCCLLCALLLPFYFDNCCILLNIYRRFESRIKSITYSNLKRCQTRLQCPKRWWRRCQRIQHSSGWWE